MPDSKKPKIYKTKVKAIYVANVPDLEKQLKILNKTGDDIDHAIELPSGVWQIFFKETDNE